MYASLQHSTFTLHPKLSIIHIKPSWLKQVAVGLSGALKFRIFHSEATHGVGEVGGSKGPTSIILYCPTQVQSCIVLVVFLFSKSEVNTLDNYKNVSTNEV